MAVKFLVTGVAAVAVAGAAAGATAALADVASAGAGGAVRPVVFGTPLPLEPPPGVPAEPTPAPNPAPAATATVPTPGEVSGILTRLTDPAIGYKEKGDLVENGITPEEGHGLDHELRKSARDGELPYTFAVAGVTPTTPGRAVADVTISGPKKAAQPTPVTLVDQGSWVLSHDSATALFQILAQH